MSWLTTRLSMRETPTCSCPLKLKWRFRTGKGRETRPSQSSNSTRERIGTNSLAPIYDLFTTSPAFRSICTEEAIATALCGLRRCQCEFAILTAHFLNLWLIVVLTRAQISHHCFVKRLCDECHFGILSVPSCLADPKQGHGKPSLPSPCHSTQGTSRGNWYFLKRKFRCHSCCFSASLLAGNGMVSSQPPETHKKKE